MSDYQDYQPPRQPSGMETASVVLGILGLLSCVIFYLALPLGAIGILLALLSRGREKHMSRRAKTGLSISLASLVLTVVLTGSAIYQYRELFSSEELQKQFREYLEYYYQEPETQSPEELLDDLLNGNQREETPDPAPSPYSDPSPSRPDNSGSYPVI